MGGPGGSRQPVHEMMEHASDIHTFYMPHGYCLLWKPWLVGLHAVADFLIFTAYAAIPVAIAIFVRKREDLQFKPLALLFAVFILMCGLTHLLQIVTLWQPVYETQGWLKGATAAASVAATIVTFLLLPTALNIPSPTQLQEVNRRLECEVASHRETLASLERANQELGRTNEELEARVAERSREAIASKERFEALVRASAQVVWTSNAQGEFLEDSPSWRAFTGQSAEEMKGDGWRAAIHPDDIERVREAWRKAVETQQPYAAEYRLRHAGDGWRWTVVTAVPVAGETGPRQEWLGMNTDITTQKETQEALQRLNAELNARIAERTAQLERARKLVALGWLSSGVAHDFNNVLAVILGNMQLLQKRVAGDDKARRLVRNAIEGAERGSKISQILLGFAERWEEARPAAVDLPRLTGELLPVLRGTLGPGVRIETRFPPDLWPAQTDAYLLEMALLSLAANARDAMPSGGGFTLSARNERLTEALDDLAPGDYVRVTVTDTGAGMTPATLARAAEPFFTTKESARGAGLGLSMVKDLAARSGGALRLSSRPGEGVTVKLWLARATALPPVIGAAVTPPPDHASTILVVDDDILTCMAAADMLADLGHHPIEANSGYRALEILKSGARVDAVVADHAMPGMTGLRLAREIRANWPHIPILIASGFAELTDASDLDLPRLNKPYDQKSLAEAINTLLRARTGGV